MTVLHDDGFSGWDGTRRPPKASSLPSRTVGKEKEKKVLAIAIWRIARHAGISRQTHFACERAVEPPILTRMVIQMDVQTE